MNGQTAFVSLINQDTVLAIASDRYSDIPFYQRWLMGTNYRRTWNTPVRLPVFYLSRSQFQVKKLGGGKQTNSLQLKDTSSQVWVLRSVDKDVKRGIPGILKILPFTAYKQDLISADHPYCALVAAELMKVAGIPAPQPQYCYVADEEALGEYRALFGNTVCMLERRDPTIDGAAAISTDSLVRKMNGDSSCKIMKKRLLKARILDMLIGDRDRHERQWRWGLIDSGDVKLFYPIPRDRDHVFFSSGGLLPVFMKQFVERHQIGFTSSSKNLKQLNRKAWEFDRVFLQGLKESDWRETAQIVCTEISDEVIDIAMQKLPPEIVALDGDLLKSKLKSRRTDFVQNVIVYYHFLFPRDEPEI
jgi:hypothetical protein